MNNFFKKLSWWMIFGVWFLIVVWIWYFALRARQNTNPWLTDSLPDALYVTNNETLSAAKRNTLVNKSKGLWTWQVGALDTTYQASSDLFVTATISCAANSVVWLEWYTDSNASPTTLRVTASWNAVNSVDNFQKNSITMPVKKWDYWKVTRDYNIYNWSCTISISSIPIW